ncbi:MAG: phosphoribosylformylglycinamidine synthase subunit PurS [Alphaproteobacteria bacterium]
MKARVHIMPRQGVLDPEGKAIERALAHLGFSGVSGVRKGKIVELQLEEENPEAARERLDDMCRRLLANTVIESYRIEVGE